MSRIKETEPSFFLALVEDAAADGMITTKRYDKIKSEMAELMQNQIERYTLGLSSSIRVEKAEDIFRSVAYTIGLFLKKQPDKDSAAKKLKSSSLSELHKEGRQLLNKKVAVAKLAYLRTVKNRFKTGNIAYNDTLRKGIYVFFRAYDQSFGADETPASIDYPLCIEVTDVSGIEFILKYLNALYFENVFLKRFSPQKIDAILRGYHPHYEELLLNIFEHVLINSFGCVLVEKNPADLFLTDLDREKLYRRFHGKSTEELALLLKNNVPLLLAKVNIKNASLENYIMSAIAKISPEIKKATENNSLFAVFLSEGKKKESTVIFEDGERLPDEKLRDLIEEIRDCRFGSDKIKMVSRLKSFDDLLEALRGGCLFDEEYHALFSTFSETVNALLLKEMPDDLSALPESDKTWMKEFLIFFKAMSKNKKEKIKAVAESISERGF